MLRRFLRVAVLVVACVGSSGCFMMRHAVGKGAVEAKTEVSKRQWYFLFGLIRINEVDAGEMAGGAANYMITTRHSFVDVLLNGLTSLVLIQSQTVTVTK